MKPEQQLQKQFLKDAPWFTKATSTSGEGFPDSVHALGDRIFLVEFKIFTGNERVGSKYTASQKPFYMRYFKESDCSDRSDIYTFAKVKERYYIFFRLTRPLVMIMDRITVDDIYEYTNLFIQKNSLLAMYFHIEKALNNGL